MMSRRRRRRRGAVPVEEVEVPVEEPEVPDTIITTTYKNGQRPTMTHNSISARN